MSKVFEGGFEEGCRYKVMLLDIDRIISDGYELDNVFNSKNHIENFYFDYVGCVGVMKSLVSSSGWCHVKWPKELGGDGDWWGYPVRHLRNLGRVDDE